MNSYLVGIGGITYGPIPATEPHTAVYRALTLYEGHGYYSESQSRPVSNKLGP
jgi:hypothetical protein